MLDAVVGGIVGGAFVTGAVLLDHGLQRTWDRRRRIEVAATRVAMNASMVTTPISDAWETPVDMAPGSSWHRTWEALLNDLEEIRLAAVWPRRDRSAVRAMADRVLAQLIAARSAYEDGHRLNVEHILTLSVRDLYSLVLGTRPLLTDQIQANKDQIVKGKPFP